MEAPNLERSASLTWNGIGGLNWDRTAVIPNNSKATTAMMDGGVRRGVRGGSFSHVSREPSPPPLPPAVTDILLLGSAGEGIDDEDDDPVTAATSPMSTAGMLPPPTLLRRSVTFSGDFPHDPNQENETLVATPPTHLNFGGHIVHQRQRATSDAAAVKAAWGAPPTQQEHGSLSPDATIFSPYSPAPPVNQKGLPRRTHSMSMEPTVWGSGSESPRERSRTSHTLSVGSPDTEVLEYLDGDDLSYGITSGGARINQYSSPPQQAMFPQPGQQISSQQQQQQNLNHHQQQQQQHRAFNQVQTLGTSSQMASHTPSTLQQHAGGVMSAPSIQQQQYMNQPPPPPHLGHAPHSQFNVYTPPGGMQVATPPSMPISGSSAAVSQQPGVGGHNGETASANPHEQNLLEIQLQNLQAMQQQWMQMMQMQFDQTLYATQQRLQTMQVGGATPPAANLSFVPPKIQKYPSNNMAAGGGSHPVNPNAVPFEMYSQHHHQAGGANNSIPGGGGVGGQMNYNINNASNNNGGGMHHPHAQARLSPPAGRPHRRGGGQNQHSQQHSQQQNDHGGSSGGGGYHHHQHSSNQQHSNQHQQPQQQQQQQSSLLTEHKITGKRLSAQELAGHVVEFSRDSHGSRLIQFKMETGTPDERRGFVNEALPHTLSLARDLFGNYVVQNFFDNAPADQRDLLAVSLMGNVSALCTHPHGCRVVQRAMFVISPARRNDLVEELLELQSGNAAQTEAIVRSCARDAHATHVLQKAVASLQRAVGVKSAYRDPVITPDAEDPPQERVRAARALERIETIVLQDCLPMCTHQQACRLVQRVLGACEPGKLSPRVTALLDEVFKNIDALSIHQNGNFVLQHILEATEPALAAQVQAFVCINAVKLARHKFGSHLVEKCLQCATQAQVNAIIERFLSPLTPEMRDDFKDDFESSTNDDVASGLIPSTLPVLMKDPYANFVVQKAFDVARGELRAKLSSEIRARTTSLSKFSYGRHILTHINRTNGNGGGGSTAVGGGMMGMGGGMISE